MNVASIIDVPSDGSFKITTTFILGSIPYTFLERQHHSTQTRKSPQAQPSLSGIRRKVASQLLIKIPGDCQLHGREGREIVGAGSNLPELQERPQQRTQGDADEALRPCHL